MRRLIIMGALLLGVALRFAPMDTAQAKEVPPDGNIPLTSEYFPDESFLKHKAMEHDKNKDGHLSPEEIDILLGGRQHVKCFLTYLPTTCLRAEANGRNLKEGEKQ